MANQDQLHGLLSYLADENHVEAHLPFILESVLYNRLLDDESADLAKFHKWITRLNSLLHSKNSTARWAGILLIKATYEQSNALYLANVSSWVLNILNVLTRPEPTSVHEIAIKTLTALFAKTVDKPEVQREVTTPNLPKFNHTLLNLSGNRDLLPVIFDALSMSITNFPTTSRPVADNCRKLCLSLLDGSADNRFEHTEKASTCLATIFLTATNANRPELWKSTVLRLLGTANRALDRLFDTIDEETTNTDRLPAYDFPPVMPEYSEAFIILFNRTVAINEALVKTLTVIKASLYELITLCLQKFGVGFGEMICKPLLNIVFEDIRIPKKRSAASAVAVSENINGKQSGKKRKRDLTNSDEIAHGQVEDSPLILLLSSLEALKALLTCYGSWLSAEQRSSIDSLLLVRILDNTNQVNNEDSNELMMEKLYECLLASVIRPIEAQASVMPHALRVFSAGANSQSHRLRVACVQGLSVCELIMHARLPPIPRTESKAAPVVYIPGLGNLVDEKSVHDEQRHSKETEENNMVNEHVQQPKTSFKDEMSNLSQRIPVPQRTFETPVDNSIPVVKASAFQPQPVVTSTTTSTQQQSVEIISPAPAAASSNAIETKPATETMHAESEAKRLRTNTEVAKANVIAQKAVVTETVSTASSTTEVSSHAAMVKKTPDVAAQTGGGSDDEEMMEMPDIVMDGPDSDVESD
ncbi:hypothetical protein Unana1_01726 [Umbelopsis nana]